ncbi:MAG: S41 family peptidase [Bacteriovoracaceae bacterium]
MSWIKRLSLTPFLLILLIACEPIPRATLTEEAKLSDMYWLFSQFSNNYAPLNYKESLYGFNFSELKQKYIEEAKATKTNEEFYLVMQKFVAEFKDAHTAADLSPSSLPGRSHVAYLGFSGKRLGDVLLVKTILSKTSAENSNYPIKVGDKISKLDGVPLKTVIDNEMVIYRNLGNKESNYTYHMNRIFNRDSLSEKMPTKTVATVTISREGVTGEFEVELPWIVQDLATFEAQKASSPTKIRLIGFDDKPKLVSTMNSAIDRAQTNYNVKNTFVFANNVAGWEQVIPVSKATEPTLEEQFALTRNLPSTPYIFLNSAKTYLTYVTRLGEVGEKKSALVGYILLDTFSPGGSTKDVILEFKQTLKELQSFGVKDIIIDMINNGGGSLGLGMGLAQALSKTKIEMPQFQTAINDNWLDDFQMTVVNGETPTEQELARRVLALLENDQRENKRLSTPFSTAQMYPYAFNGNSDIKQPFKITLLVNEMCASMCDIFTSILKDNSMAYVIGQQTMGAGGNVVQHYHAPNSHLIVNQTESLMLKKDGTYIENNGLMPDQMMDVSATSDEKYNKVREAAFTYILNQL